MAIHIDLNRIGVPRFGLSQAQWRGVCEQAKRYQDNPALDWPDGTIPDPREQNARLCFTRWLVRTGRIRP
jgi:hypothetical protein